MTTEPELAAIGVELTRLGADPESAGERDSIGINDELDGWVSLGASEERADFYWYGRVPELLTRLRRLPAGGGPGAVRAEFRSDYPG